MVSYEIGTFQSRPLYAIISPIKIAVALSTPIFRNEPQSLAWKTSESIQAIAHLMNECKTKLTREFKIFLPHLTYISGSFSLSTVLVSCIYM